MEDLPILQKIDAGAKLLSLYRTLKANNVRMDEKFLMWCEDVGFADADDLLYCLRFLTVGKLMRYIGEQFESLRKIKNNYGGLRYESPLRVFLEYKDYLNLCEGLKYDLTDDFILFPRHLNEAHDRTTEFFKEHETEVYDRIIAADSAAVAGSKEKAPQIRRHPA